jgi:hypothetical protein
MGVFDDILRAAPAEDQAIFNKYPQLKTATEKLENDYASASRFAGEWVNWQQKYWDADHGMTREEKRLSDELAAAQARLSAGVNTGADADEVAALRKEFETKLAETRKASEDQINGMNFFYRAAASRLLPHQQEFGENLDPNALMTFMTTNRITDPDVAYDRMVAGRRSELAAKRQKELDEKHAADLEAARQEGYNKRAQEVAMGPNGSLPTDNTGGIAGVTARVEQSAQQLPDDVKAIIAGAKPGDGQLAALGYKMFTQGAFSQQQQ